MQVNIIEAKNRPSLLVKSARRGEEVVIADRGEPVVGLVALEPASKREDTAAGQGDAADVFGWLERNPLPVYAKRSARAIYSSVQDERDACDRSTGQ